MFPDVHTNKFLADIVKTDWGRGVGAFTNSAKVASGP